MTISCEVAVVSSTNEEVEPLMVQFPQPIESGTPSVSIPQIVGGRYCGDLVHVAYRYQGGFEGGSMFEWLKSADGE